MNTQHGTGQGKDMGRRRIRMTRETGQALVFSSLCGGCGAEGTRLPIEVRVSQVCAGGVAILEVLLPDNMFVERKETQDGVRALFPQAVPKTSAVVDTHDGSAVLLAD